MGDITLPAKLDKKLVAKVLGFEEHDINILVSCGLLNPLGNPVQNARKYFALCDIEPLFQDRKWLHKAQKTVYSYWNEKNARKRTAHDDNEPAELAA